MPTITIRLDVTMALTFGNVALVIALVVVSMLLGNRIGRKRLYLKGVEDGLSMAAEVNNSIFQLISERYDFVPKDGKDFRKAE